MGEISIKMRTVGQSDTNGKEMRGEMVAYQVSWRI
jgi:hypothetical protein